MRYQLIGVALAAQGAIILSGLHSPASLVSFSFLASAIILESATAFEDVAKDLSKSGFKAAAPAMIVGKSGVKHEFALAVFKDDGKPEVVVDTELSVREVDEIKVLKFYVKVLDVAPKGAVLCVSPKLAERAVALAREYQIKVLEDEVPRQLIPKASGLVRTLVGKTN